MCVAASKSKVLHTISKVERARTKTSNLYLSSSVSAIFATSGGAGTSVRLNAAGPKVPKDYDWSTDALRPGVLVGRFSTSTWFRICWRRSRNHPGQRSNGRHK